LLGLDKKVFGTITTKEVIGADPLAIPDTQNNFEKELVILLAELTSNSEIDLEKLLEEQKIAETHINNRPGAMALAQDKIQIFNVFNQKYVKAIKEKQQS
jgi:hypothetical protein